MTHYSILGVAENAKSEVIKFAFDNLWAKYSSDINKESSRESLEKMLAIKSAYDVLSDPVRRKLYDSSVGKVFHKSPEQPQKQPVVKTLVPECESASSSPATTSDFEASGTANLVKFIPTLTALCILWMLEGGGLFGLGAGIVTGGVSAIPALVVAFLLSRIGKFKKSFFMIFPVFLLIFHGLLFSVLISWLKTTAVTQAPAQEKSSLLRNDLAIKDDSQHETEGVPSSVRPLPEEEIKQSKVVPRVISVPTGNLITDGYTAEDGKIHMVGGNNYKKPWLGFVLNQKTMTEDTAILNGDYKTAYAIYYWKWWDHADYSAAHNLAMMLYQGLGVEKDLEQSVMFFDFAITQRPLSNTSSTFRERALAGK